MTGSKGRASARIRRWSREHPLVRVCSARHTWNVPPRCHGLPSCTAHSISVHSWINSRAVQPKKAGNSKYEDKGSVHRFPLHCSAHLYWWTILILAAKEGGEAQVRGQGLGAGRHTAGRPRGGEAAETEVRHSVNTE